MTARLLTARTVADMLDVTPATVLRWTRAGELPALRLPSGQIRYREDELDDWLGERATPGRGVRTTTTDAAQVGRYSAGDPESLPGSTDVRAERLEVASVARTTTRGTARAPEDEE